MEVSRANWFAWARSCALRAFKSPALLYSLVASAAILGLLERPGTIGHHWDWLIPSSPKELCEWAQGAGLSWQTFSLGSFIAYRLPSAFFVYVTGQLGCAGLSGALVTKGLVLTSILGSCLTMRSALLFIGSKVGATELTARHATTAAILYGLSPYVYNQIIAGDQLALYAYPLAPAALVEMWRACETGPPRSWLPHAALACILLSLIAVSPQIAFLDAVLGVPLVLAYAETGTATIRLLGLLAACLLVSAYWILPLVAGGLAIRSAVATTAAGSIFAALVQFNDLFWTATGAAFPGDFYVHALGGGGLPLFVAAFVTVWLIAVAGIWKRPSFVGKCCGAAYAVSAVLPLGGAPLVGPVILAAYNRAAPATYFFRTPQHLMFLVALSLPILVFLGIESVAALRNGLGYLAAILAIGGIAQGFVTHSGYLGLIGPFRQAIGENRVDDVVARGGPLFRTEFVPSAESYYYHPGIFDYFFEGGDEPSVRFAPSISFAPGPTWSPYRPTQELLKLIDESTQGRPEAQRLRLFLDMTAVKYVVLREGAVPAGGVNLLHPSLAAVEAALNSMRRLEPLLRVGGYRVWSYAAAVPRVYVPDCTFTVPPSASAYDVMAFAGVDDHCVRPAFIADAASPEDPLLPHRLSADRADSQLIVYADDFRVAQKVSEHGIALRLAPGESNTHVVLPDERHAVAIFGDRAGAVATFNLSSPLLTAHNIVFHVASTVSGAFVVSLLAPDFRNRYDIGLWLSPGTFDDAVNLSGVQHIGTPEVSRIAALRVALRGEPVAAGYVEISDVYDTSAAATSAVDGSLVQDDWDGYYYGSPRWRIALIGQPRQKGDQFVADVAVRRTSKYSIFARVQPDPSAPSAGIDVSVGGDDLGCHPPRPRLTEDLIYEGTRRLAAGQHQLSVHFCGANGSTTLALISVLLSDLRPEQAGMSTAEQVTAGPFGSFRVRLPEKTPRYLVLLDSYDPRWLAEQDGRPLDHLKANGFANAWLVPDPSLGPVTIEFWPQRLYTAGILIAAASAICLGCLAIWSLRRG